MIFYGIGKYSLYQLDSLIITLNRPSAIIGFIVSSFVGISITVSFYYALKKLGTDYLIIKNVLVSIFMWIFFELLLTAFIEGRYFNPRPLNDYYIHIIG